MTESDLNTLLATANLNDEVEALMLADLLEDFGRVVEARFVREFAGLTFEWSREGEPDRQLWIVRLVARR